MSASSTYQQSGTDTALAAATATDLLPGGTSGFDITRASMWTMSVVNTGANSFTVKVYYAPNGTTFGEVPALATAFGTIASGADLAVSDSFFGLGRLRIVATSAGGTTVTWGFRAVGEVA